MMTRIIEQNKVDLSLQQDSLNMILDWPKIGGDTTRLYLPATT